MKRGGKLSEETKAKIAAAHLRRYSAYEERFHAMVDRSGGPDACWPWKGGTEARKRDNRAYVKVRWHGKDMYAHRIAVLLDGRPARDDEVVDHMCKHVRCCNPRHLRVCHQLDNVGKYADRSKAPEKMKAWWDSIPKEERSRMARERWERRRAREGSVG